MSVIFSRQCEYALQAVSYLALRPPGTHSSIKELTNKLAIPYHFLGKILQDLTNKGMLTSQKGPNGGFALAKRPEKITRLASRSSAASTTPGQTRDWYRPPSQSISSPMVGRLLPVCGEYATGLAASG